MAPAQPVVRSYVGEYEEDVKNHMISLEDLHRIPNLHLSKLQGEVSERERAIIIDWLVDVHWCLQLSSTTLQLAVHILDRVLCCREVYIDELELVSLAAFSLAAKYEDGDYAPKLAKLLGFIDNDRTRKEFVTMEKAVLQCIEYDLGAPTALHFFRRQVLKTGASEETMAIGHFILELGLCHYSICAFRPSEVAASAALLARLIVDVMMCDESKSATTIDQELYSCSDAGYSAAQLANCVRVLHQILCCSKNTVEKAVRQKYSKCRAFNIGELDAIAHGLKLL